MRAKYGIVPVYVVGLYAHPDLRVGADGDALAALRAAPNSTNEFRLTLVRDVSEVLPLRNTSFEFRKWAPVLWSIAVDYAASMQAGASQIDKGGSAERFPCCNQCSPMPTCCACTTG